MTAGNNESCLKRQKVLRGECTTKRRENEKNRWSTKSNSQFHFYYFFLCPQFTTINTPLTKMILDENSNDSNIIIVTQ